MDRITNTSAGHPPTPQPGPGQFARIGETLSYEAYTKSASAGDAVWVTEDKQSLTTEGGRLDYTTTRYGNTIPVVDALYMEEPPVVVIATRIIEERKQQQKTTLWQMPSDTWLELSVYVHSFYKKYDKRKGLQTFHPTITGHIPTTREGRDQIMPPKATVNIMRRFINSDLFLTAKEKRQTVTINTQDAYSSTTTRGKCVPEEPALGKYEYQEQQLQRYLMGRYVDNNWFCKHVAPPLPDCACCELWGNYDQTKQGWCCWSCKILFPIALLLLILSYWMLAAANSNDSILTMQMNAQGVYAESDAVFCTRMDYQGTFEFVCLNNTTTATKVCMYGH